MHKYAIKAHSGYLQGDKGFFIYAEGIICAVKL